MAPAVAAANLGRSRSPTVPAAAWGRSRSTTVPAVAAEGRSSVSEADSTRVWTKVASHRRPPVESSQAVRRPWNCCPQDWNGCRQELAHSPPGHECPVAMWSRSSESSQRSSGPPHRPAQQLGQGTRSRATAVEPLPPSVKANPGNCREELRPSVPESNPITTASTHTTIAVIQVILTAARPVNLTSDAFLMTTNTVPCTEFSSRVNSPPEGCARQANVYPGSRRGP